MLPDSLASRKALSGAPGVGQEPKHCLADTNRDGDGVLRDAVTPASPVRKAKNQPRHAVKDAVTSRERG